MKVNWSKLKEFVDHRGLSVQWVEESSHYSLSAIDGALTFTCKLDKNPTDTTDLTDFETNYKASGNKSPNIIYPFAQKRHYDGRKLTRRIHGFKIDLDTSGTEQTVKFTIPYVACLMTSTSVVDAIPGDKLQFSVLDSTAGLLTGVPNYRLNQFGYDVYPAKDYYEERSEYDAELVVGLQLEIKVTPVDTTARSVYFNITLHELT